MHKNLILIIIAGLLNGSFVIPMRYLKKVSSEVVWLHHSLIGLAILPWVILGLIQPDIFKHYLSLPLMDGLLLLLGGVIFGIGQACFAYAIGLVGMALSFAVNLGLAVTIGSMFVVFYKSNVILTSGNLIVSLAVGLILISLALYYFAGKNNQQATEQGHNSNYSRGWLLASIAGVTSGLQNITFVVITSHADKVFAHANTFWVWPPFLCAAALPMVISFYRRAQQQKQEIALIKFPGLSLVILMGLLYAGSMALYSTGMTDLGQQEAIGWPGFMISIILSTQIWSKIYKEAQMQNIKSKIFVGLSIALLILAIILLGLYG